MQYSVTFIFLTQKQSILLIQLILGREVWLSKNQLTLTLERLNPKYSQLSWKRKLATVKSKKADVSSISVSLLFWRRDNARKVSFLIFTVANLRFQLSC